LHQRYFATAERAVQDDVLWEYDDDFAHARQKVSLKYLAEKEHKNHSGSSTGTFQFGGTRQRRGRGGSFTGHGFPPNHATAAVGSSSSGARAPGAEFKKFSGPWAPLCMLVFKHT
ncbi:hypothetical protein Vretimale_10766, partial [Volvox reticuliferus]